MSLLPPWPFLDERRLANLPDNRVYMIELFRSLDYRSEPRIDPSMATILA